MISPALEDARASDPIERLLEDSWDTRARQVERREFVAESAAAALLLACAIPMAIVAAEQQPLQPLRAVVLVCLYAVVSRMIKFPLGAGYVVPSYAVLVPMLVLLPPGTVPLLAAAGLALGTVIQCLTRQARPERLLFSVADAWHAVGPALVLWVSGPPDAGLPLVLAYVAAFIAGCVFDLVSSTLREAAALGIAPRLQVRVMAVVWLVDAGLAPMGLMVASASRESALMALLILPMNVLLVLLVKDRNARIDQAQHRLDLVATERTRLQAAVGRLGDAFSAKLELDALIEIVLRGSVEALGAEAGRLTLDDPDGPHISEITVTPASAAALEIAGGLATVTGSPQQVQRDGAWALALPFGYATDTLSVRGALTVARGDRAFREDEQALMARLTERARRAASDIVAHQTLRAQAVLDPLTGLGNRRKFTSELEELLLSASADAPLVLALFDLDGFKSYNDTFGHPAGDALLVQLGMRLAAAMASHGAAYRLGGDEFCVVFSTARCAAREALAAASAALELQVNGMTIGASCGAVVLPHEARDATTALRLADERMYANKHGRTSAAGQQTRDVLMGVMAAKHGGLHSHCGEVADLARRVARRMGMSPEAVDDTARAAELHDIGKVAVPDEILHKPGPLEPAEWAVVREHSLLGERILSAAPALRPVALIVRAVHERWDGNGYPDRAAGTRIPQSARIVAACDAYGAMTSDRCYRAALSHAETCAELRREAGRQFDPGVIDALLAELAPREVETQSSPSAEGMERIFAHVRAVLDDAGAQSLPATA